MTTKLRTPFKGLDSLRQRRNAASHARRILPGEFARQVWMTLPELALPLQGALHNCMLSAGSPTAGRGKTRLTRLIRLTQELAPAHWRRRLHATAGAAVSLRRLSEQVISDFLLLAEGKDIALGLTVRPPVTDDDTCDLAADPQGLIMLLNDLLGRAIRSTPRGGTIVLVLTRVGGRPGFEVIESGPAVPE